MFTSAADRGKERSEDELKALHAKIGPPALAIDFLSGALGRINDPSAKRGGVPQGLRLSLGGQNPAREVHRLLRSAAPAQSHWTLATRLSILRIAA